jgi:uncharacterized protein YbjQ (UPF0145 family)
MKQHHLAATACLAWFTLVAQAADPDYFSYRELFARRSVQAFSDPSVKIYLANDAKPAFAEKSRPDTYTGSGISISPFGGSRRHCVEAFENALQAMIKDAATKGFDAIIDLRAMIGDDLSADPDGFTCAPSYKVTIVSLHATFGLTQTAARRVAEEDKRLLNQPYRPPWEYSVYVPLEPILASAEAQAMLGPDLKAYSGNDTPLYTVRVGPDDYAASAPIGSLEIPTACKIATLKALQGMVDEAREQKFDSIIKIRSRMYEQYTPGLASVECEVGKNAVYVNFQATLVNRN